MRRGEAIAHWGGTHDLPEDTTARLSVRRVRLNSGGYTSSSGQYFGLGAPLYHVTDEDDAVDFWIRASSRGSALAIVRDIYPRARFAGARSR